ncbi:hypothetical protein PIB30_046971 [Stylosanthes scabra]|uniref:Uncharacterized protein n=1 Tax=Stylosanthes scabra TaxID=79078 RepID=A0ABU6TGF2_9FABA|nr:hypothetical protein [Stylosanthes scabra]
MSMDTPLLLDGNSGNPSNYGDENEKPLSLVKRFGFESKKLWKIAGPAIITALCQYSLGALTITFTGLVDELDLAAVSVQTSVIAGLAFGIMLGMGSALETLCGQAYGAGQIRMLGVYMQRSWVILLTTALILVPVYVWSPPILKLIGQTTQISDAAGRLPNPLVPVDAISICMNINGWDAMIAIGFNAAISVRVSNELGAGDFKAAKFSVLVVSITSVSIGVLAMIVVLTTREYFPYLFTSSGAVAKETTKLASLLGVTVLLNSLQPVLSGVAVGAGWQSLVAYINIGCYYVVGLPAGILLGFTFGFGTVGIWSGMIGGIVLQTMILIIVTLVTNWRREAEDAESRVKKWGGSSAYTE